MKQVILTTPLTINPKDVSIKKFYGVSICKGESRAFITKREFEHGAYTVLCADKFTEGNGYPRWDSYNLTDLITKLLDHNHEVFEFDTFRELMNWVAGPEMI
jgi:hypothetical protein